MPVRRIGLSAQNLRLAGVSVRNDLEAISISCYHYPNSVARIGRVRITWMDDGQRSFRFLDADNSFRPRTRVMDLSSLQQSSVRCTRRRPWENLRGLNRSLRTACSVLCLWLLSAGTLESQDSAAPKAAEEPSVQLPAGFRPSSKPLIEIGLENELLTDEEEAAFKRPDPVRKRPMILEFRDALKAGNPSDTQRQAIRQGVRWHFGRLTRLTYRDNLFKLRQEILRDAQLFAKSDNARQAYLREVVHAAEELTEPRKFEITHDRRQDIVIKITELAADGTEKTREVKAKTFAELQRKRADDPEAVELFELYGDRELFFGGQGGLQGFRVRLNVVVLLTELNIQEGNVAKEIPSIPYVPAADALLRVISDDDQLNAFRVPAVKGLARICLFGEMDRNDKRRPIIAQTLIDEAKKSNTHWWYRKVLMEALGSVGILHAGKDTANPIIAQTLAETMADRKEHWAVRCAAAKALGRAPLDSKIVLDPIAFELANLGLQLAQDYNKQPTETQWKNCCLDLYFAFRPVTRNEKTSDQRKSAGLVENSPSNRMVRDAYNQLLPPIRQILKAKAGAAIPAQTIAALRAWLNNNRPSDLKISAQGKPISAAPKAPESK